ncbi:hypothetical protein BKA70DRAFT_1329129 [Coprinopsis sp. MPI-PUGE-AT-0042]|nr:hypothetical protein BKA70DRAFT_1329129 [Coprinopsis sp. MPI-PUGE-AT-0042]
MRPCWSCGIAVSESVHSVEGRCRVVLGVGRFRRIERRREITALIQFTPTVLGPTYRTKHSHNQSPRPILPISSMSAEGSQVRHVSGLGSWCLAEREHMPSNVHGPHARQCDKRQPDLDIRKKPENPSLDSQVYDGPCARLGYPGPCRPQERDYPASVASSGGWIGCASFEERGGAASSTWSGNVFSHCLDCSIDFGRQRIGPGASWNRGCDMNNDLGNRYDRRHGPWARMCWLSENTETLGGWKIARRFQK